MKILVISKRQYTGHDLIDDRFGRLREIPLALARLGHEVRGLCLSYASREEGTTADRDPDSSATVNWESMNAGRLFLPGLFRFTRRAESVVADYRPDIIWAASDSIYGILGNRLARRIATRCIFDVYDNFESFAAVSIPGVRRLYLRSIRDSAGVTCVSEALARLLESTSGRETEIRVVENGVRRDLFFPRDKEASRDELRLPQDATIVGVAGALSKSRGIETIFDGFRKLASENESIHLVVAGPRDRELPLPSGPRVHDMGLLPLDRVPALINAMDVAVIANRDSAFGRYCFPQKLNEITTCEVPFVAANVGAVSAIMQNCRECLFEPGNADDFARAIRYQLKHGFLLDRPAPGWDEQAALIDDYMQSVKHAGAIRQG